jgi:ATP-dependent DNA helicase RecQ
MKGDHPITIDQRRTDAPAGGLWEALDPVAQGRVQILPAGANPLDQAMAVMMELSRLASLASEWDWAKAAVIARQWKYLEPIKAYCELHGMPAQMAYEQPPHFWRLRETQALIRWLKESEQKLLRPAAVQEWLERQPPGPWFDLLREAADAYAVEVADAELPREHFLEWLAEWGRDARRRQTGLMLVTAHRAKGLEFDHVVVVDGGWNRNQRTCGSALPSAKPNLKDPDTERRLYYVAMTRARKTLALARLQGRHALLYGLAPHPAIFERRSRPLETPPPELARRHVRLTLQDVDLGYAGRFESPHQVHTAIAALQPGDPLTLREGQGGTEILDASGAVVGRLARGYRAPSGLRCITAVVGAVVCRKVDDGSAGFSARVASDAWEVVVPELTYQGS